MEKKMYLGLDMGTGSVGWAVTDEHYALRRAKGKDLWGVRLFDEADTSAERRGYRISRRRRQREIARIGLLQEYFSEAISQVDPGFFHRLKESALWMEDRSNDNKQKNALFCDKNYTDKDYYEEYKTIFHLRKKLLTLKHGETVDVRLVYLALANMFHHRGHFLTTSLASDTDGGDMESAYQNLVEIAEAFSIVLPYREGIAKELECCLGEKGISRSAVVENTQKLLGITKKEKSAYGLLRLMCGCTVVLSSIYGTEIVGEENKKFSFGFRETNYEDNETKAREILGDDFFALIDSVKQVHDIGLLANIMKGHSHLTFARVEAYDKHHDDLQKLKAVLKQYDSEAYHDMFRIMSDKNYSAYVGSVNYDKDEKNGTDGILRRTEKCPSQEDFYKTVKKVLEKVPDSEPAKKEILSDIEAGQFMPKQMTGANGVIPNQVYVKEMKQILHNVESFLPFLLEKNEQGLTVSEQILQIFSFHIPYYVGPLGGKGDNVWAKRLERGRILPWNFEKKIDTGQAAEDFIKRMVRHCTYLTGEQTLPKQSLLYQKFMVLNEINSIRVNEERLPVELKQRIYQEVFQKGKKVTEKQLKDALIRMGAVSKTDEVFITGINDKGPQASLSSYGKFCSVFKTDCLTDEQQNIAEQIIFWSTVYGEEKKLVRMRIEETYGMVLSPEEKKRILGLKFEGWGNLSREFLQMTGSDYEKDLTIIGALWNSSNNLMELLSERHTFQQVLREKTACAEKGLSEWTYEDLNDMYLSAPVKRMVWQTLKILKELTEVTKQTPDRIFVEMAREDGAKGIQKESRKAKLLELYHGIKSDERDWKEEIEQYSEADFRSKKLYLYYLQQGRCMYSKEKIELADLFNDSLYDIDHVYPRRYVKDDSLQNNLVLVKQEINRDKKKDKFPLDAAVQQKMSSFWKGLLDKGFLTKEKYYRLTRKDSFSDEELVAFINRQLVETRQGTKAITQILTAAFPQTQIVFTKAGLVTDFRQQFSLLKTRCVNDFHHAQDAYLNIVVGNAYYVKFTANPMNYIRDAQKYNLHYHMGKLFLYNIERNGENAWDKDNSITQIKKTLKKSSVLLTKRSYIAHGGVTRKDTIYRNTIAKEENYYPVKSKDSALADVSKYGGRTSINNMCYTLVEYKLKGQRILSLEALPGYLGDAETISRETVLCYLLKSLEMESKGKQITDMTIKYPIIRLRSKIRVDGHTYYLAGKTGAQICIENAEPLKLCDASALYCKKIEKAIQSGYYDEKDKNKKPVITEEKNLALWKELKEKVASPCYKNRKGTIWNVLDKGEATFLQLSVQNQCSVLQNLLLWFQLSCESVNLSLIGGSKNAGKCIMSKKLTNCKEVKLVLESVTGLYEREVDLLKL